MILHAWRFMLMCPLLLACGTEGGVELTAKEAFGKLLFFDRNLSLESNQSCSTCHLREAGWSGDDSAINAHGACSMKWPDNTEEFCTGDGGNLALSREQRAVIDREYDQIALSIAAYEASPEVNSYTSKFDYFLAGLVPLTPEENLGLLVFGEKGRFANCHVVEQGPNGEPPLFTDFTFDNLGVPRNPENPWYTMPASFNPDGTRWLDLGLGEFLASRADYRQFAQENDGMQKVPTLRNVDRRPTPNFIKAYMHNGYFKTLKGVVHFYNTRDVKATCKNPLTREADAIADNCWPEPQVKNNVNKSELGNLGLTEAEELALLGLCRLYPTISNRRRGSSALPPACARLHWINDIGESMKGGSNARLSWSADESSASKSLPTCWNRSQEA